MVSALVAGRGQLAFQLLGLGIGGGRRGASGRQIGLERLDARGAGLGVAAGRGQLAFQLFGLGIGGGRRGARGRQFSLERRDPGVAIGHFLGRVGELGGVGGDLLLLGLQALTQIAGLGGELSIVLCNCCNCAVSAGAAGGGVTSAGAVAGGAVSAGAAACCAQPAAGTASRPVSSRAAEPRSLSFASFMSLLPSCCQAGSLAAIPASI